MKLRLSHRSKTSARRQRRFADNNQPEANPPKKLLSSSVRQRLKERTEVNNHKMTYLRLKRLGLLIVLVAATAFVVNTLSLSANARIVPLTTSSNKLLLRPSSTYAVAANRILKSTIWDHSKITVDANGLSNQMLNKFPELADVSLDIPLLGHQPLVYIEPAQPVLVLDASNGAFLIASSGKALLDLSGSVLAAFNLPTVTDQSDLTIQLNHQVLPANYVMFIQAVITELAAKDFNVSSMTLPPTSSELDVHLSGQPYFIKFNLENNDPREQTGTFLAVINELKKQNMMPSQYIDVRVDGRAYYQ